MGRMPGRSSLYAPQSSLDSLWAATKAAIELRKKTPSLSTPWAQLARPEQLPPPGSWRVWYIQGGRGSGKTRAGSEWLADELKTQPAKEWAIVAPTFGDGRDKCVEGESGLLHALNRRGISYTWNRSYGQLTTDTGHKVHVDGGDDGALRIQGFNLAGCWADEVGLWKKWRTAWDESVAFAVRVTPARIVATGTPKVGHKLVKRLIDDSKDSDAETVRTLLRTADNVDNLDEVQISLLNRRYKGTQLERQELQGEYITELPNALWSTEQLETSRVSTLPDLQRVVTAIDPAVTANEDSDETGIIVAGIGACTLCNVKRPTMRDSKPRLEAHGFVLADYSGRYKPYRWAYAAKNAMRDWEGDRVIGEVNNGGDLVETTIKTVWPNAPFKSIRASRGKRMRAEPISSLYAQGKVHHFGAHSDLENQMLAFTGDDGDEDDRVDALVMALTELFGREDKEFFIGWAR